MTKDYFPEEPFPCACCNLNALDPAMREKLNQARERLGKPMIINSGCRCVAHNAAVGGSSISAHLPGPDGLCHAADIDCQDVYTRFRLYDIFRSLGFVRIEVSNKHIHVDNASYLPQNILGVAWIK